MEIKPTRKIGKKFHLSKSQLQKLHRGKNRDILETTPAKLLQNHALYKIANDPSELMYTLDFTPKENCN